MLKNVSTSKELNICGSERRVRGSTLDRIGVTAVCLKAEGTDLGHVQPSPIVALS